MSNSVRIGTIEAYEYTSDGRLASKLRDGFHDLMDAIALRRMWMILAGRDMRQETSRTLLGPFWTVIATSIQVGALGYVYGYLFSVEPELGFPSLAAGLVLWFYISSCVVGGLTVFQNGASVLKERSFPVSFTVFRYLGRVVIELTYKFGVFFATLVLVQVWPGANMLLAIPCLALFLLNGIWVILLFGVIGARFSDVRQLVMPLMLIFFLITPVLWPRKAMQGSLVAEINPFTHYLEIVREPLLGHDVPIASLEIVLALTVIGFALAFFVFALNKDRIVFWV